MSITSRYTFVQNFRTHFYAAGNRGSNVLLLHGGGIDSAALSWDPSVPILSANHRVIAVDLPGYGSSERPDINYTQEFYLQFIHDFMDAMGLKTASLVGLSMGGGLALGCALNWPERVERLGLVDSYGLANQVPSQHLSYVLINTPLLNRLTWSAFARSRGLARNSLESIFADPVAISPALVDQVYSEACKPNAGRAFTSFQKSELGWANLRTVYMDRLSEICQPVLLIHGKQDKLVPVAYATQAAERLPNARLCLIDEAGHWPQRERPHEFNQILVEFLQD